MSVVLDASALLAFLQLEPGHETVGNVLAESVISTVNWAEVIGKCIAGDVETEGLLEDIRALGLAVVPFSSAEAELAGRLAQPTRALGLSLGDRACLALGLARGDSIYTADRTWRRLRLDVAIETIR